MEEVKEELFEDDIPDDIYEEDSIEDIENYVDETRDEDFEVDVPEVSGFVWFLPKRKYYKMVLENRHYRKCIQCLREKLNASSNRYLVRKTQQKYTRFDDMQRANFRLQMQNEMLNERLKQTVELMNDKLEAKEESIVILTEERDYLREQLKQAQTANVVKDDKSNQFQSKDGRTADEKRVLCYWLKEDGKDVAYMMKHLSLTSEKTVEGYIRAGRKMLGKMYGEVIINGQHRKVPYTNINADGTWKEDPEELVYDFNCPLAEFYEEIKED